MTTTTESPPAATEAPATEAPATRSRRPPKHRPPTHRRRRHRRPSRRPPRRRRPVTRLPSRSPSSPSSRSSSSPPWRTPPRPTSTANEGIEIEYFSCASPADVDCQIAQIEDAVVKGFDAMVITPMGNDVIPALDAAADSGLGGRARRQRPRRLHEEDRGRRDRQRRRRPARRRVPQVGPQGGRHDRVDGRRPRRARTRRAHPGRPGCTRGHRRRGHHRRCRDQVRLRPGSHGGRGPAHPGARPDRDLLGLRRSGDRRRQGRQGSGQAGAWSSATTGCRPPPRRSSTAT